MLKIRSKNAQTYVGHVFIGKMTLLHYYSQSYPQKMWATLHYPQKEEHLGVIRYYTFVFVPVIFLIKSLAFKRK